MQLTLVFDHRFYVAEDGIRSLKHYDYEFFRSRYLTDFDSVRVVARVKGPTVSPGDEFPLGPGVSILSVGDWRGLAAAAAALPRAVAVLRRALQQAQCVSLIVPGMLSSFAAPYCKAAGRPYGVEVVTDPADMLSAGSFRHPLRPLVQALVVRRLRAECANAAVAVYVTREALQRRYPTRGAAYGVSDAVLPSAAFSGRVDSPGSVFKVINVGAFSQLYKAQDVSIDAAALLKDAGLQFELTFIGDGPNRPVMESRAEKRGVTGQVRFLGQVTAGDGVRECLDCADLFILPSRQEGLPRAMLEAMARGLPCVGSNVGGIPELLPAEAIVPVNDPRSLADAILRFAGDETARRRLAERCVETARDYSEDRTIPRRREAYRRLIDHTRGVHEAVDMRLNATGQIEATAVGARSRGSR